VEFICDTLAASIVYKGKEWTRYSPLEYWNNRKDKDYINPKIVNLLDEVYAQVNKYGIYKTINKKNLKYLYKQNVEL
jgi:hypothetical protein